MAVTQTLEVTEVAGSPSAATNTSRVRILWKSIQSGTSWNGYTRTAKYYIAINGGAETEYTVSYTLPQGTTQTILDTIITVTHKEDGSGTVKVRTWMDTDISAGVIEKTQTVTLTAIARASSITSAGGVTLGNKCNVKWTPKSAAFRYKLKFAMGGWNGTTGVIHPNQTAEYTYTGYPIPLDAANQIPNAKTGTMTVTLYTYSDSGATAQVGAGDSKTFPVTVPDNDSTKPDASMTLSPVSSLAAAFAGLYIQGKTRVKASLSGTGKYGADVQGYSVKVEGTSYGSSDNYISGYLAQYGDIKVTGYATDARGYVGSVEITIPVIPYAKPKIQAASGESGVVAARCDAEGNLSDSGTYLKIKAKRVYSKVISGSVQKNFCQIRYRYKWSKAAAYSEWVPILEADDLDSDEITTGALLGGVLLATNSYLVQVGVADAIGETAVTTIQIPTEKVYWHRDGARQAFSFGGYVEEDNTFAIAEDILFQAKGPVEFPNEQWVSLGLSENVSESSIEIGRGPAGTGCWYRVLAGGKHVQVAFNCGLTYSGNQIIVNAQLIPEAYSPPRNTYSFCVSGGRTISRVFATHSGKVILEWVQLLTSSEATAAASLTWIDGYLDYWI